jgi:hypothetical protein
MCCPMRKSTLCAGKKRGSSPEQDHDAMIVGQPWEKARRVWDKTVSAPRWLGEPYGVLRLTRVAE